MKITEFLIEHKNDGRPVHMRLLKKLLKTVPVFDFSFLQAKTIDQLHIKQGQSTYGGTVYNITVDSTDTDGKPHSNTLPVDINDQLAKFKQAELEPLKNRIAELESEVHK